MATRRLAETKTPPSPPRSRGFSALGARVEAAPIAPGLYVVATPIGNLADVTLRALATLAAADAVLAEDTRVSRHLLDRYEIATPLVAYHEHNAAQVRPRILARLAARRSAGADLGRRHAADLRPRLQAGGRGRGGGNRADERPRPFGGAGGADAARRCRPTGSSSKASCRPRRRRGASASTPWRAIPATLLFYEAPGRLAAALADLAAELGPRPRRGRARTDQALRGNAPRNAWPSSPRITPPKGAPKGEIVIVVGPPQAARAARRGRARSRDRRGARRPLGQGRRRRGRRANRPAAPAGLRARAAARRRAALMAKRPAAARRRAHLFGLRAEAIAALLLRLKGYRILARRFAVSGGEIDLVVQRGRDDRLRRGQGARRSRRRPRARSARPSAGAFPAPRGSGSRATPGRRARRCAATRCSSRRGGFPATSARRIGWTSTERKSSPPCL